MCHFPWPTLQPLPIGGIGVCPVVGPSGLLEEEKSLSGTSGKGSSVLKVLTGEKLLSHPRPSEVTGSFLGA